MRECDNFCGILSFLWHFSYGWQFEIWLLCALFLIFLQVFRSIDSGSVKGFPKHVAEAEKQVIYEFHGHILAA